MRDAGNLLTRAGLNIPAVDVDEIVVRYSHPARLIAHLRVRHANTVLCLVNISPAGGIAVGSCSMAILPMRSHFASGVECGRTQRPIGNQYAT